MTHIIYGTILAASLILNLIMFSTAVRLIQEYKQQIRILKMKGIK